MGGTHGSGVVSSADDVQEMSMSVDGACEMCMFWLGVGVIELGLGFTNPVETGEVWVAVVWVVTWSMVWMGRLVLCMCELRVWILCVDGRFKYWYLYIVLGG